MNHRIAGAVVILLGFLGATLQGDGGLENRVTTLEAKVDQLEERVAIVPLTEPVPGSTTNQTPSSITITGTGDTVSDSFRLNEGSYRVGLRYEGEGYVSIAIKEAPQSSGFINYGDLMSGSDLPYAGEHLVEVYDAGEFAVVASGSGKFTVIIEV